MEFKKDLVTDGWSFRRILSVMDGALLGPSGNGRSSTRILSGMDGAILRSDWGWMELLWDRY
eukprot:1874649-Pyramimonas_sp.AAC.1